MSSKYSHLTDSIKGNKEFIGKTPEALPWIYCPFSSFYEKKKIFCTVCICIGHFVIFYLQSCELRYWCHWYSCFACQRDSNVHELGEIRGSWKLELPFSFQSVFFIVQKGIFSLRTSIYNYLSVKKFKHIFHYLYNSSFHYGGLCSCSNDACMRRLENKYFETQCAYACISKKACEKKLQKSSHWLNPPQFHN